MHRLIASLALGCAVVFAGPALAQDAGPYDAGPYDAGYDAGVPDSGGPICRLVSTTGPSARASHVMAYDNARQRTVLFGGVSDAGALSDTWEWDGASWTQRASTGPTPRFGSSMVYDSARHVALLFGGSSGPDDGGSFGDTWEWDGNSWSQVSDVGPSPRSFHSAAYDSLRDRVVLFGGWEPVPVPNVPWLGDTWEWDGSRWAQVADGGPFPGQGSSMAYATDRGQVVLVGTGFFGQDPPWEWDGLAWASRPLTGQGPRRYFSALAFDDNARLTLRLGGMGHVNGISFPLGDLAAWDGVRWASISDTPAMARWGHAIAYDSHRSVTVVFGGFDTGGYVVPVPPPGQSGFLGDTWECSLAGWTEPDAGLVDAGLVDAGDVDAGGADAGRVDASTADSGLADAGADDAGVSPTPTPTPCGCSQTGVAWWWLLLLVIAVRPLSAVSKRT